MRIGIIGGTGMGSFDSSTEPRGDTVQTAFGEALVIWHELAGRKVAFVPRHGPGHSTPPHRVNYRANIAALHKLGIRNVLATAAVGAIAEHLRPGQLVIPDQFLDFTKQRPLTFWDGDDGKVVHIDLTQPYCPRLRDALIDAAADLNLDCAEQGTYVCVEGPRFESAAEIRMYRELGGDIIGMTAIPELVLAREASMCYAAACIVTNPAAGLAGDRVAHEDVEQVMGRARTHVLAVLEDTIRRLEDDPDCACRRAGPPLSYSTA